MPLPFNPFDPRYALDPMRRDESWTGKMAELSMLASKGETKRYEPMAAFIEVRGVPVKIEELFQDNVRSVVTSFLELQTVFSEEIQGIYYVPNKYIKQESGLADRINLVVRLRGFCLTSYVHNSIKDGKTLVDYWNDGKTDKDRFWSIRTTKLVLTLMQMHNRSKFLSLWVQGNATICSVQMFNDQTKIIKISPEEMFKLVR